MHACSPTARLVVLLLLALAPAAVGLAQGYDAQEPPPSELHAHYEKGEVWYESAWVRMSRLLDECRRARKAMETVVDETAATQDRISDITKRLAQTDEKYRVDKVPMERDLAQAIDKGRHAAAVLSLPPPAKPRMQHHSGRGDKRNDRRDRARIRRENKRRQEQYQAALKRYKQRQEQARKSLNEAKAAAQRAKDRLEKLYADYKGDQKPLLTRRTEITQESRSDQGKAGAFQSAIFRIAAVLAEVPESIRARYGVVEWQKTFWSIPELKALHKSLEAEIRAGRKKAEQALTGNASLPSTWTHPRQAEADAIQARIRGAEADMQKAKRDAE